MLTLPAYSSSLGELISSSLEHHPAALVQQALAAGSASDLESSRWQYFPTPSVSVEAVNANKNDLFYRGDDRVTTLRLQQPLWTGGRLSAGVEKSENALKQSKANERVVRSQIAIRVVQAYSEWLTSQLRLVVALRNYDAHSRMGDQVRRRAELGASADSDRSLVAVRMDSIAGEIAQLRGQVAAARARVSQLVGRPLDQQALLDLVVAAYPIRHSEADLLQLAVANSPVIDRLRAAEQVAAATISERKSELWPQIYIRVERQFGNFAMLNSDPSTRYFIGLSSALGAGLSNQSAIGKALAQQQAALAEIDAQEREIKEEILTDYAQLSMLDERHKAVQSSIAVASQIVDSYLRQFLAGRKTWTDVMNAAREYAQYQAQGAELDGNRVFLSWRLAINSYGLGAVIGGGTSE